MSRSFACALFFVSKDNSGKRITASKRVSRASRTEKRTSKRRGELAELAFLWKAASLGFAVSKPYGDSERYDFIVDSGHRLSRVQVKSASRLSQGTYFLTTQRCCNGVCIPYTSDEIDFIAGYLFPEDAWVLIPVEALDGRASVHIFPQHRKDHGIYARYREAWCQLACARQPGASLTIEPRCAGRSQTACPLHLQPSPRS